MNTLIDQLVKKYGYEFGDLIDNPMELPKFEKIWNNSWNYDYGSEPFWSSLNHRNIEYETVTKMFLGIPEEYGCGNAGIDIGIQGYPI